MNGERERDREWEATKIHLFVVSFLFAFKLDCFCANVYFVGIFLLFQWYEYFHVFVDIFIKVFCLPFFLSVSLSIFNGIYLKKSILGNIWCGCSPKTFTLSTIDISSKCFIRKANIQLLSVYFRSYIVYGAVSIFERAKSRETYYPNILFIRQIW